MPYASNHMEELPSLFKNPINKANFDCCVVNKQWHLLKNVARSHYSGIDAHSLQKKYSFTDIMNSRMSVDG